MVELLERVVLPLADPDDAAATCQAIREYDVGHVIAVHVIEKGGGAPDKASVEQREQYADEIFDVVTDAVGEELTVETRVAYGTDVAETIFDVADETDASAIVISPRGGSRWIRLLTGDVALSLVTETNRPVLVLPDSGDEDDSTADVASEDAERGSNRE